MLFCRCPLPERLHGRLLKGQPNRGIVAVGKTGSLNHEHQDQVFVRVGPALGGVSSAVPKSARGEHGGDPLGGFHDRESKAEAHALHKSRLDIAGLRGGHLLDGGSREQPFSTAHASIQHHLIEGREIRGGGIEAARGVGGSISVGDGALDEVNLGFLKRFAARGGLVRLGEVMALSRGWPEGGVGHAEGIQEARLQEVLEFLARDHLHNPPQGVYSGVAVFPAAARFKLQRTLRVAHD